MSKQDKTLKKVLSGLADKNIAFRDLRGLLILNLQPKGSSSKPYQVKQVRDLILKYQLGEIESE